MQKYLHVHVWGEEKRWTNPFPWGYAFTLSDWHVSPLFSIIGVILSQMFNSKSIMQLRKFQLLGTMGTFKDGLWTEIQKSHTLCFPSLHSKTQAAYCFPQGPSIFPPKDKRPTHWFYWESSVCCGGTKKPSERGLWFGFPLIFFFTLLITKQKLVVFPR